MPLKPLLFELPKLEETHSSRVRRSREKLKKRASSIGQRSPRLDAAVDRMKGVLRGFGRKDVAGNITGPLEAKAFAKIFAHDELATRLLMSDSTLNAIDNVGPVIKRQTLMLLIEGYLRHYDEGLDQPALERLGTFIRQKLSLFENEKRSSDLSSIATHRSRIFSLNGPRELVTWAQGQGLDLVAAFETMGLSAYCEGRYFLICRYQYYLEELKAIPLGKHHRILDEIVDRSVYMSPGKDMLHLGHEILCIIIDRAKGSVLSDAWMKVILDIAGDPRVPEANQNHRLWWNRLGAARINLMRGWLSRLDLKLFLNVLNDYGKSSGDTDLQRMYPARKRFLEGLIDHGLVSNSRLFINPKAENFLKRGYKKEDLPEYAIVRDSYRSMIYLQVGHLHMVEGSHSFKLWIFPKLPQASTVLDYNQREFYPLDLSSELDRLYWKEFGRGAPSPADIVHRPAKFSWQHQAIKYLRDNGMALDIEKLFSKQDYAKYIKIHGL